MAEESGLAALYNQFSAGLPTEATPTPPEPAAPTDDGYRILQTPAGPVRVSNNFTDEEALGMIRKQRPELFTPKPKAKPIPHGHAARSPDETVHPSFAEAQRGSYPTFDPAEAALNADVTMSQEEEQQIPRAYKFAPTPAPSLDKATTPQAKQQALRAILTGMPQATAAAEPIDPEKQGPGAAFLSALPEVVAAPLQTYGEHAQELGLPGGQKALEYAREASTQGKKLWQPTTDVQVAEARQQGMGPYAAAKSRQVAEEMAHFVGVWGPAIGLGAVESLPAAALGTAYTFSQIYKGLSDRLDALGKKPEGGMVEKDINALLQTAVFSLLPAGMNKAGLSDIIAPSVAKLTQIFNTAGPEAAKQAAGSIVGNIAKSYMASTAMAVPGLIATEEMTRKTTGEPSVSWEEVPGMIESAAIMSAPTAPFHGVGARQRARGAVEDLTTQKANAEAATNQQFEQQRAEDQARVWPEMRTGTPRDRTQTTTEASTTPGVAEPAPPTGEVNLAQPVDWVQTQDGFPNTVEGLQGFIAHHKEKMQNEVVRRNPEVEAPIEAALLEANKRLRDLRGTAQKKAPPEPTGIPPSAELLPWPVEGAPTEEAPKPYHETLGLSPKSAPFKALAQLDINNPEHHDAILQTVQTAIDNPRLKVKDVDALTALRDQLQPTEAPSAEQITETGAPDGSGGPQPVFREEGGDQAVGGQGMEPSGQGEQAPEVQVPEEKVATPEGAVAWKKAFEAQRKSKQQEEDEALIRQIGRNEYAQRGEDGEPEELFFSLGAPTPKEELVDRALRRLNYREETGEDMWVPGVGSKQVQGTLRKLLTQRDAGEITEEQMHSQLNDLLDQVTIKAAERKYALKDRARGPDFIRQRMLQARRQGVLSDRAVDMAEWFIKKNPALVEDLGISIKGAAPEGEEGTAGFYGKANRVFTLIAENAKDTTAIHETLHHLERMMPPNIRSGIAKAWTRSLTRERDTARKAGDEQLTAFFDAALTGDARATKAALKELNRDQVEAHYQHFSPSEFWAVNGARILENRYNSSPAFLKRLATWLREFGQHIKSTLGFKSDAPILRAIDTMLKEKAPERRTERLLTEEIGKQDAQLLASYVGEQAIGADLSALKEAKRRLEEGEDEQAVRRGTGWFKGEDDKWRYEIDDSALKWKQEWDQIPKHTAGAVLKLGDVLEGPVLEAYPELKDARFKKQNAPFDFLKTVKGGFDPLTKTLTVTLNNADATEAKSTALHEIQHWIQNKENFTPGGNQDTVSLSDNAALDKYEAHLNRTTNPTYFRLQAEARKVWGMPYTALDPLDRQIVLARVLEGKEFDALTEEQQKSIANLAESYSDYHKGVRDTEDDFKRLDVLRDPQEQKEIAGLENAIGEAKASVAILKEQRATLKEQMEADFDRWQEGRKADYEKANAARWAMIRESHNYMLHTPEYAEARAKIPPDPEYPSLFDEAAMAFKMPYELLRKSNEDKIKEARQRVDVAEREYKDKLKGYSNIKYGLYRLIGGEREARDVQERMYMTPEERMEVPPYTLTGIEAGETIRPTKADLQTEPSESREAPEREEEKRPELTKLEERGQVIRTVFDAIKGGVKFIVDPEYRIEKYARARQELVAESAGLEKVLRGKEIYDPDTGIRADYIRNQADSVGHMAIAGITKGFPYMDPATKYTRIIDSPRFSLVDIKRTASELPLTTDYLGRKAKPIKIMGDILRIKMGEQELKEVSNARSRLARLERMASPNKEAKEEMADLRDFIKEFEAGRGREQVVRDEDVMWANQLLAKMPRAQDIVDRWKGLNENLLDYAVASNWLSKDTAEAWKERWYAPMYKSKEDIEAGRTIPGFPSGGPRSVGRVKGKKGSKQTVNVWENLARHYTYMLGNSITNNAKVQAYKQLERIGLAKQTSPEDKSLNVVKMNMEGKPFAYKVFDADAFRSLTMANLGPNAWIEALAAPARWVRATSLMQPGFWYRTILRDPAAANLLTTGRPHPWGPFRAIPFTPFHAAYELGKMALQINKGAKELRDYAVTGYYGSQGSIENFSKGLAKSSLMKTMGEKLHAIHSAMDESMRVAIYKAAQAEAKRDGITDPQAIKDIAAIRAQEFTNFSTRGHSQMVRRYGQITPFFHAQLAGLDKMIRQASGYAAGGKKASERAKANFVTGAALMSGLSMAYAFVMLHDKRYRDLPIKEWTNNFIIYDDPEDPHGLKLPIPQELGFWFKILPEITMRRAMGLSDDAESKKAFNSAFLDLMAPPGTLDFALPPAFRGIQIMQSGIEPHSGLPVESQFESGLLPEDRDKRARMFGKFLAKHLPEEVGLSPNKIDAFMRTLFSTSYDYGMMAAEIMWESMVEKKRGMFELPFDKDFTEWFPVAKDLYTNPRNISATPKFYEMAKPIYMTMNSVNKAAFEGDVDRFKELTDDPEMQNRVKAYPAVTEIKQEINEIERALTTLEHRKDINEQQKRKLYWENVMRRNELARKGFELIAEVLKKDHRAQKDMNAAEKWHIDSSENRTLPEE